jgi:hypothetical protein
MGFAAVIVAEDFGWWEGLHPQLKTRSADLEHLR